MEMDNQSPLLSFPPQTSKYSINVRKSAALPVCTQKEKKVRLVGWTTEMCRVAYESLNWTGIVGFQKPTSLNNLVSSLQKSIYLYRNGLLLGCYCGKPQFLNLVQLGRNMDIQFLSSLFCQVFSF
jgi:hypothetical protein